MDVGYLSHQMISDTNKVGCLVLMNGKTNMLEVIKSIKVDEVDETEQSGGLNLNDEKIKLIPHHKQLDMHVEVSYKAQIGETADDKAIMEAVRQCVRVVLCHSERKADQVRFLVNNLHDTVPFCVVLSLMRTSWQIENLF